MARLDALNVTFHAKLGTQGEDGSSASAPWPPKVAFPAGADYKLVDRAVVLAKADLRTEGRRRVPELQGVMGRKYAVCRAKGGVVSTAIEEHKPRGPSDQLPQDEVAITVALYRQARYADRFLGRRQREADELEGPSLRRAALGVIRIILERGVRDASAAHRQPHGASTWISATPLPPTTMSRQLDLLSFFHDRLKVYLRDQGARHDLIDAVLTPETDDLRMVARRVEALHGLRRLRGRQEPACRHQARRAAAGRRGEEGHRGRRWRLEKRF